MINHRATRSAAIISTYQLLMLLMLGAFGLVQTSEYEAMRESVAHLIGSLQTLQPRLGTESGLMKAHQSTRKLNLDQVDLVLCIWHWVNVALDSHVFSDRVLLTYLPRPYSGSTANGINIMPPLFSTFGAGRLMMTHYGSLSESLNGKNAKRNVIQQHRLEQPSDIFVPSLLSELAHALATLR